MMTLSKLLQTKLYLVAIILISATFAAAQSQSVDMSVYSYVSPPAKEILKKAGLSEEVIESFVAEGLQKRSIRPIDSNRVYEGSEDAFRVDLRKAANSLLINLSVRQGASVHNMLQRWERSHKLILSPSSSPEKFRSDFFSVITKLLDNLKSVYNSEAYKKGSMMEE